MKKLIKAAADTAIVTYKNKTYLDGRVGAGGHVYFNDGQFEYVPPSKNFDGTPIPSKVGYVIEKTSRKTSTGYSTVPKRSAARVEVIYPDEQ